MEAVSLDILDVLVILQILLQEKKKWHSGWRGKWEEGRSFLFLLRVGGINSVLLLIEVIQYREKTDFFSCRRGDNY